MHANTRARSWARPWWLPAFATLAVGIMLLVACGDDDDDTASTGDDGAATGASTSTTVESSATQAEGSTTEASTMTESTITATTTFTVTSSAFGDAGAIPVQFTCDGDNISFPITWLPRPEGTESYAIILDDPDAGETPYTHWLAYDLPASVAGLLQNQRQGEYLGIEAPQGTNDNGSLGYFGPCPPQGAGEHSYVLTVYALDAMTGLAPAATRAEVDAAIEGHIVEQASITGTYSR